MLYLVALATFLSTFLGGLFALRFRDKLHLLLGFSAGAVLGVVFFDILPEAIGVGLSPTGDKLVQPETIFLITLIGFLIYMMINRSIAHNHDEQETHIHHSNLGAGSLSLHSLLDGVGIGIAYQVSPAVGTVVAVGVLVHDFSDGINTVNMVLRAGGTYKRALSWLATDALAPVLGIILASLINPSESILAMLLALFAGFFLYIGASDLLPESHHSHPTHFTTIATILGAFVIYWAIKLVGM